MLVGESSCRCPLRKARVLFLSNIRDCTNTDVMHINCHKLHLAINSLTILTVSKATESPQKDLLINASHISRRSILADILSRSTGNYHVTIY